MGHHTPGPWQRAQNSGGPVYIIAQPHWPRICTLRDIDDEQEQTQANARLIAAAPELLAALRLCLLEVVQFHAEYHNDCKDGCPARQAINAADSAIAKAEGVQS